LVSASCGGRGASIVAPCHIVLAKLDQLVPDLESAFARVGERNIQFQNSFVGLITGSSRTADIEKILVQGAHGPRQLVVVLQTGP
jgi:L-lactate dehydrogenase complex protein LldG